MKTKISGLSRVLLILGSILLVVSLFFPLWRIELEAPQYPEGLMLQLHPNKIGGDVDIINGLNHYIGMKTLHSEDFFEFTILPYIIGFFAGIFLLSGILGNKKLMYTTFVLFLLFGVVSMIDFYRWNYDYGHDLDPNAAIKVPGMAYQPPVLGYKQLLNFGAYSIPDIGGWMFIVTGVFILIAVVLESGLLQKFKKVTPVGAVLLGFLLFSCGRTEPEKINYNTDECDYCKMSIADARFGTEIITQKGRVYKFDDISCLLEYRKENAKTEFASFWVPDFVGKGEFVNAEKAFYVVSEKIKSPMGGNTAAFKTESDAKKLADEHQSTVVDWKKITAE
jgi:copper chaperone NosL